MSFSNIFEVVYAVTSHPQYTKWWGWTLSVLLAITIQSTNNLYSMIYCSTFQWKISSTLISAEKHWVKSVKSVRIWSYSGPCFPAFGLNTERYSLSLRIQSECGKIQTRITPNTDTFYAVKTIFIKNKRALNLPLILTLFFS